ncbi:MAG: F0F1 ATP synthase subunit delta [Paludibacter sp.]|nr:F0F1 ATP synthase subunit delta [Paludibacter sp.]
MNSGLIATRYAKALLRFAYNNKSSANVYREMKVMSGSFENTHLLMLMLEDPVINSEIKKKVLLTSAGKNVSQTTSRFIDLVLKNKREVFLQSMALSYIDIYRKKNNIHKTIITTASAIDHTTEMRLIALIESEIKGTVEFEKKIDKSILGGFVIEVDFKRWDGSLSNQLKSIKEKLNQWN